MDIAGLVLKFIGGEKLKKVTSVFADGQNITRQIGGGIGINSIFSSSINMQTVFSQSGLSGIMNNPLSGNISSLISNVTTSLPAIVSAKITNSGNQSDNQPPAAFYPTFAPALSSALAGLNTYSRMTDLLTGNAAPDYTTDEFGIADTLDATASQNASFEDLNAPIDLSLLNQQTLQAFLILLQNAENKSVSDSDATQELSALMSPILTSMNRSNQAYFNATQISTANTLLSEIFSYLTGISTPQSDFIESIMRPEFVEEAVAANQYQAALANANHADSTPESLKDLAHHEEKLRSLRSRVLTN